MKRLAACSLLSLLLFQLGCALDQCGGCGQSACPSYSDASRCWQKGCEQKGGGDYGCSQKGCAQKGCGKYDAAQKGCAQKGCGKYDTTQKGCAKKGCGHYGHEQKGHAQRGFGHYDCEQKAGQQELGYAPESLEEVTPTPVARSIDNSLNYEGLVR